ncbi:MAG: AMIN domain-containing protein [Cyanobacteria bacterium P01_A01_bin.114]
MGYQQIGGWLQSGILATTLVVPLAVSTSLIFPGKASAQDLSGQALSGRELSAWSFDPSTQALEFSLPEGVMPQFFLLAEPARIVLDIPETQLGDVDTEQTYEGAIERIRVSQFSDNAVRIVVDLMPGTELEPEQADIQFDDVDGRRQWRFRPLIAGVVPTVAAAEQAEPFSSLNSPGAESLILPPNLSADSLQAEQSDSASHSLNELPLDPYAPAADAEVVSVPSLADAPIAPVEPSSVPPGINPSDNPPSININTLDTQVAGAAEVPPMSAPDVTTNSAEAVQIQPEADAIAAAPAQTTGDSAAAPRPEALPNLTGPAAPLSTPATAIETESDVVAPPPTSELRAVVVTPQASPSSAPESIPESTAPESNVSESTAPESTVPEGSDISSIEGDLVEPIEGDLVDPESVEPANTVEEDMSETTAIAASFSPLTEPSLEPSLTPFPAAEQTEAESTAPELFNISDSKDPNQTTPISVWPEPISFGQPLPN